MAFEIRVPRLGWSMEEGTFAGWHKKEGELVKTGDVLFSLEGEKATQEIESLDSGTLHIHPNSPTTGQVVAVGALLGVLLPKGESQSITSQNKQVDEETAQEQQQHTQADPGFEAPASPSIRRLARQKGITLADIQGSGKGGRILAEDLELKPAQDRKTPQSSNSRFATPRARKLAQNLGIDWGKIEGSGKGGRVRERDVQPDKASVKEISVRAPKSESIAIPLTQMRKRIAERLLLSRQTTVPVTITTKAEATQLVALRSQFKKTGGLVPAFTDILGKLVALCLVRHPILAGQWKGDHIAQPGPNGMHIGIAVDTDQGLLVPVVRDLANASLSEIAKETHRLAKQAREGKLSADAMQGGVFTISSLGSLGVEFFTPVINPPESAILGVGAIQNEAMPRDDGTFVAKLRLPLSLTFDHRIMDGAPAARFLKDLVLMIENPAAVLLTTQF